MPARRSVVDGRALSCRLAACGGKRLRRRAFAPALGFRKLFAFRLASSGMAARAVDFSGTGRAPRDDSNVKTFEGTMQLPIQVTFRGLSPSPALKSRIRHNAGKLERFHGRITSCRVSVEATNRDSQLGRQFQVRVDLTVPGAEIVARREAGKDHSGEDVYTAIRDAFAAVTRQLEDVVRKRRGDVKHHEPPVRSRP
jgi:ribosomal subunit interface protein